MARALRSASGGGDGGGGRGQPVSRSARGVEGMRMPVAENRGQEERARPPRGSTLEQSSLTLPNVTQGKRVENRERRKAPYMAGPPPPPHPSGARAPALRSGR